MKAYTDKFKKMIAVSSLALIATAAPVFAQNSPDSGSQPVQESQSTIQVNEPRAQAPESPSYLPQRDMEIQRDATSGRVINEPAGADNGGRNWTWLGLLGLLGLFGMKRRHEAHDDQYRPVRP